MRLMRILGIITVLSLTSTGAFAIQSIGSLAIYTDFVGWIAQPTAQQHAQTILAEQNVFSDASIMSAQQLATWMDARTGDNALDMVITFGATPLSIYNGQADGSPVEEFILGGDFFLNTADYIFYVSDGGVSGDSALKNITSSNFDLWTDGNASAPTDDGERYIPSLRGFTAPRAFKTDQVDGDPNWEVEVVFGDNGATFAEPAIIRHIETGGRVGIIQQVPDDAQNRGETISDLINNWVGEIAATLSVDASGKMATTWGSLKAR